MRVCAHVWRGWGRCAGCCINLCLNSLDRRSLPEAGARLPASKPQQSFGVLSLLLPLQELVATCIFVLNVGTGDSNSAPHVCAEE